VVDLLRACDVCLHAGVVEGMPLGLLEAQACGVPVVAYAAAGVPEAVIDGATALLAPPGDVDALTGALRRLTLDGSMRCRFASAARANAVAEHGIERQADRIAEVITTVARRTQR
jgi:glycosyltransferase involved in cell wall biosynthesis